MRLQEIGSFDSPLYVTAPPGDEQRVFVVEQGGTVRVVRDGKTLSKPFLDVSDEISSGGERGLLSIAFAPDYAQSGLFYVYYTDDNGDTRVIEYKRRTDDEADPGSARQVLVQRSRSPTTTAACSLFGPDKLLYIGLGDGGGGGDQHGPIGNGQSLDTLLGKILRIDPRRAARGRTRCPQDNPFVERSGAKPEIYSYGLRNPWRFSFDRQTGDLTIGDVGQDAIEEIYFVRKGKGAGRTSAGACSRAATATPTARRAGRDQARDRPQPRRRQLLDHRRHRRPRPGAAGLARALRLRRLLPRRAADRRAVEPGRRAR